MPFLGMESQAAIWGTEKIEVGPTCLQVVEQLQSSCTEKMGCLLLVILSGKTANNRNKLIVVSFPIIPQFCGYQVQYKHLYLTLQSQHVSMIRAI